MTSLSISLPDRSPELAWICSVIFGEFLGIEYTVHFGDSARFLIFSDDCRYIALPNDFFARLSNAVDHATASHVTASMPLAAWDTRSTCLGPNLLDPRVPVVFGDPRCLFLADENAVHLPLDIFGSAFFMLSRYEESVGAVRDQHDRFPVQASLAYRAGFLHRPIIDEYVQILRSAIEFLWPGIKSKRRRGRTLVSCDLDSPFDPACASLYRMGKRMLGRAWRDKSLTGLAAIASNYREVRKGNFSADPYRAAIDWMMTVNEEAGNRVAFYFIPCSTDARFDNRYNLDDPRVRQLMRSIHERGHEIGVHPGYNTYRHPEAFKASVEILRRVMQEEHVAQVSIGGRQHYLRWDAMVTAQLYAESGLSYDSTLNFGSEPGFRCGTCHEYPMFDLANRKALAVRQRPLIVMDNDWMEAESALERISYYKNTCAQFDGDFTLLWHNSSFHGTASRDMYREAIK